MKGQNPPDLNDTLIFSHVGTTKNLTVTARELGLSPATVSARVKALEERFGVALFIRKAKGVELTQAGVEYYAICMKLREEWVAAEAHMAAFATEPVGKVRIGTTSGLYHEVLGPLLPAFQERHPDVLVECVVEGRPLNIAGDPSSLAISPWEAAYTDLPGRNVGVVTLVLYASKEYLARRGMPAAPEDLVHHAILRYEVPGHTDIPVTLTDGTDEVIIPLPRATFVSADIVAVREAAARGVGITLSYEKGITFRDELVRVLPTWRSKRTFPVRVAFGRRDLTAAARALVDYLAAVAPELPSLGGSGTPPGRAIWLVPD